ncbi:MAG TPA: 16S rRNA (cytidine(1402)-2'-O)-methyltransferase [Patescibacteria group bacterium]|nr:16S rRNA (cytidine(1402)-2'-O)-methyltransferase [Patescibacteria group bacterium]
MTSIYIVGTPIGNLQDITFRAIEILRNVDFVLAEDTRKTKVLLEYYKINKPIISYHQHSTEAKVSHIVNLLKSNQNLALVTDAGTPGVSDPGNHLLDALWQKKLNGLNVDIIPIPGASSVTTILSVCGFPTDDFLFLGFLPKKKGRETLLKSLRQEKRTIVIFESPYRVVKSLENIEKFLGNIDVVIGRELTKKFEEILRGKLKDVVKYLKRKNPKGEFVVVLNNR